MNTGFTIDELERSVKNPFYEKLNRKAVVSIRHEDYEVFSEAAKLNGERVTAEDIMRRCLADYAKILKEHA
ncbi:MAG: hypothetical protein LBE35_04405 [Clostridiales bacterium]|jgi:hypothetical protein|nr:hypothetical protein [Clostridiales bacterium]